LPFAKKKIKGEKTVAGLIKEFGQKIVYLVASQIKPKPSPTPNIINCPQSPPGGAKPQYRYQNQAAACAPQ